MEPDKIDKLLKKLKNRKKDHNGITIKISERLLSKLAARLLRLILESI